MSQLKLSGTVFTPEEFRFAIGFVATDTELLQHMYGNLGEPTDEVTRTYQGVVFMTASVVHILAKNALAHAEAPNGALAANSEAEIARVLFTAIEPHRKQLDLCEEGNPPAMPAKPDKAALTEMVAALRQRFDDVVWKIELSQDADRAEAARLLRASAEMLLEAAASGLVEATVDLSDEAVAAKVASDTQRLIDSGKFTEETAAAKIKEIYGETPEAHKAFLLEMVRKQLAIGTEGLEMANLITTAEQCPLVAQLFDNIEDILSGKIVAEAAPADTTTGTAEAAAQGAETATAEVTAQAVETTQPADTTTPAGDPPQS